MAVQTPQLVKINKKTGTNTYTLYHPQTGAEFVLYHGTNGVPWPSNLPPQYATEYNADGTAKASGDAGGYYSIEAVLHYINDVIDQFTDVLEFCGTSTIANLPSGTLSNRGKVYIVTNSSIYWSESGSGNWVKYPTNTLFVCTGHNDEAYISSSSSGDTNHPGWFPLGGDESVYAYKSEAVSNLEVTGSGIHLIYADGSSTTVSGSVTTSISSSSGTALVTEGAVYNFASTASTVNVSTNIEQSTDATYYLTFVSGASAGGKTVYIDSDLQALKYNPYKHLLDTGISGYASYAYEVEVQAPINTGYLLGMSSSSAVKETISPAQSGIKWDTTAAGAGAASKYLNVNITGNASHAASADEATWAANVSINGPSNTGYILGDNSVTQGTHETAPIQSGIKWDTTAAGAGAASKYLNVNITGNAATATSANYATSAGSASTATTAGSVSQSLSVLGQSYNGSTAKTISKGNGLTTTTSGNTTTISVGGSNSITVNTNSIAVKTSTGLTVGTNGVQLDTSGVTAGVYSAVQVDVYGRTTVGAQSVVWAPNLNDSSLNDLVVNGVAFVTP